MVAMNKWQDITDMEVNKGILDLSCGVRIRDDKILVRVARASVTILQVRRQTKTDADPCRKLTRFSASS